jgi:4-methyl-5(b-hydroxyethyl)-thiazole monophosphate biosynthesis
MKAIIILAPGFEEVEALAPADMLRRAGVEVVLTGTTAGLIEGRNKIKVMPDAPLESVKDDTVDLIVLPGGMPGTLNLKNNPVVIKMVKRHHASGKLVAAICAAPTVLAFAGIIEGRTVACHPSVEDELKAGHTVAHEPVAVDGKIITSRGPGTAMEFGLKLVEILCGKEASDKVRTALVV